MTDPIIAAEARAELLGALAFCAERHRFCTHVLDLLDSGALDHEGLIFFTDLTDPTLEAISLEVKLSTMIFLCGYPNPIFDAVSILKDQEESIELDNAQTSELMRTGEFAHPKTGQPVSDPTFKTFLCFRLNKSLLPAPAFTQAAPEP